MRVLFFMIFFLCFRLAATGQNYIDSLDSQLLQYYNKNEIPGFGVFFISGNQNYFINGYGYQDESSKLPYTEHTIQNIGSISKTIISVLLMKLVEQGDLNLDDDINKYIDLEIKNPHYPESKITLRHLATHTSSLLDGEDDFLIEKSYLFSEKLHYENGIVPLDYKDLFEIYNQNTFMDMWQFLKNTYSVNQKWYDLKNFCDCEPGTEYHYSNMASTLLAHIIEKVSRKPYYILAHETIFGPLKMNESFWTFEGISKKHLSRNHLSSGFLLPHYRLITYPDGGLHTSLSDFSKYIREMLNGLNGEGILLSSSSYKEIFTNQYSHSLFNNLSRKKHGGLFWTLNEDGDNISANGADPGIASYVLMTTESNLAIYIIMNKSIDGNELVLDEFKSIRGILFRYAGKIKNQVDQN